MEPISLHKYIYANCNSVNGIDPTGLFTMTEQSAVIQGLGWQTTTTYSITSSVVQAARITAGFVALAAGASAGLYLLEAVKKNNRNEYEYKLYPEDPRQRKVINDDTDNANQMRVQLQYKRQHDHGIALLATSEIGVTKSQVYRGLNELWATRRNGDWFSSSQDRNMYRAVVEVSETVKASAPVSIARQQVATSQWFPDGRQAPRADYRVDVENLRGKNLRI